MLRHRLLLPLLGGLLLLTACEDPSNVGIGLVDEQGDPETRVLTPTLFEATPLRDVTGNVLRVLVGSVEDPLVGTVSATGYVDFQLALFDNTNNPPILAVSLVLPTDYVYGDTTLGLTLNVFDLVEDWTSADATADTSLPKGALVTAFDFLPTDTLVTVPLPDAWIAANDTTLRSAAFESLFHGFALETAAAGGNAVVGFRGDQGSLRVVTDSDTLSYPLTRTITGTARAGTPALPPGRIAVQDGAGPTVRFDFDFRSEDLRETPLNAAAFRFFADTLSVREAPPGFVRNLQRRLLLFGVREDDSSFLLAEADLDANGQYRFSQPPILGVNSLRDLVQATFFGEELYDRFELRTPSAGNSIDMILLYDTTAAPTAPEAVLTLTPGIR